jgi:ABC-type molybdenum transport system ATPase subunit/photorepair protein PhrA
VNVRGHRTSWESYDPQDEGRARQLLGQVGIGALVDREFGTLSEGSASAP